jgi:hypothetical protein
MLVAMRTRGKQLLVIAFVTAILLTVSGCGVLFRASLRIVVRVAAEVIITEGEEYLQQVTDGDTSRSNSITINYAGTAGERRQEVYSMAAAGKVEVSKLDGEVSMSGNGSGQITVSVPAGTEVEIHISTTGHRGGPGAETETGPEQTVRRYVEAMLDQRDEKRAAAFVCADAQLETVVEMKNQLVNVEQRFNIQRQSIRATVASYTESRTGGDVTADTEILESISDENRSTSEQTSRFRFGLVDERGWKVCTALRLQ